MQMSYSPHSTELLPPPRPLLLPLRFLFRSPAAAAATVADGAWQRQVSWADPLAVVGGFYEVHHASGPLLPEEQEQIAALLGTQFLRDGVFWALVAFVTVANLVQSGLKEIEVAEQQHHSFNETNKECVEYAHNPQKELELSHTFLGLSIGWLLVAVATTRYLKYRKGQFNKMQRVVAIMRTKSPAALRSAPPPLPSNSKWKRVQSLAQKQKQNQASKSHVEIEMSDCPVHQQVTPQATRKLPALPIGDSTRSKLPADTAARNVEPLDQPAPERKQRRAPKLDDRPLPSLDVQRHQNMQSAQIMTISNTASLEEIREILCAVVANKQNISASTRAELLNVLHTESDREVLVGICSDEGIDTVPPDAVSAEDIFQLVDTDGSGAISFEEFSAWWSERQLATQGTLNEETMAEVSRIWAESDLDGSGGLDPDEFASVLAKVAESEWRRAVDPVTNRPYFYHKTIKESRWIDRNSSAQVAEFLKRQGIKIEKETFEL